MINRHARVLAGAALLMCLGLPLYAAGPVFWQTSTRADLLKGDVENLSIDYDGRLRLGPEIQLLHDSTSPFLWAILQGPDGSFYIGSGNEGKVYRVDRSGKAAVFYDAPELEIHALAPAPDGGLYVGSSPDGRIYKVDPKGDATTFFDPKDKYIWALAADGHGSLFAATGDKGTIYRIGPDGKGEVFYQTKATHVVSLAFDHHGNLIAGTESPGMVFRIDPKGKPFVVLDSSFREIHALRIAGDDTIYAVAVGSKDESNPPSPEQPGETGGSAVKVLPGASVSTEVTAISVLDLAAAAVAGPHGLEQQHAAAKGAVYRILPDGTPDTMWESSEDLPYDVLLEPGGSLLVATGNKGKIYRVIPNDPPKVTLLTRAPAQQVTGLLAQPDQTPVLITANPGKLMRIAQQQADSGTYLSDVRDAQTVSAWGTISWRATIPRAGQVQIFTRTGNSQTPDDTWSDWSPSYSNPTGQQVTSPKARFLQWKAVLSGKQSPVLNSVTVAYLPRNVRPDVTSITVYPPGVVFQKPFSTGEMEIAGFEPGPETGSQAAGVQPSGGSSTPALGRRAYQKGLQTFIWRADDDNGDDLQYDVLYRRDDETEWKTLKQGLTDPIFVWDTTSVPNGTYTVRIVASDSPSNPQSTAMSGEKDSAPFDIDNTPPTIQVKGTRLEGGRFVLLFEVRDDQSAVQRVDYSIDADRWQPIYPVDGIADSRFEQYELPLASQAQAHDLVIRAADVMNNVSTARGDAGATAQTGANR